MLQLPFTRTILFFTRDTLFFTLSALQIKYESLHPKAVQYVATDPWHLERTAASALHTELHCVGEEGRVRPARAEAKPFTLSRKLNNT